MKENLTSKTGHFHFAKSGHYHVAGTDKKLDKKLFFVVIKKSFYSALREANSNKPAEMIILGINTYKFSLYLSLMEVQK